MSHFLIVGPATKALKTYLDGHEHSFTRLIDRSQTKFPDVPINGRVVTNFADEETYLTAADSINKESLIDGVLVTYENSVLPAAKIAHHLGLPGLPIEAAEAATDKFLMRQKFATASEPISPDFMVVNSEAELREFANNHSFPLILKPANLAKSLLVTKNESLDQLIDNYRQTLGQIANVYKRYSPHRQPKLLVEEFMHGSIHSVDAFMGQDGTPYILDAIVDYLTGYEVGFDDSFHYSRLMPSQLSEKSKAAIMRVAELGCRTLNIQSSPAHIEIIMTKNGPRLVEIGARNGGYRERMHRIANGIDILGAYLSVALGQKPNVTKQRNDSCAVLELFPKKAGAFEAIQAEEQVRKLPSFKQLNIKVAQGQHVGRAADGFKMCAMIMLHNPDRQQFLRDLDFVNNNVSVQTSEIDKQP